MGAKIRKEIYIEPEQDALLKKLSDETGLSEAELLGQAVERCIETANMQPSDPQAWTQAREFILDLIKQGPVPGGRTWKREDLYDREIFRRH